MGGVCDGGGYVYGGESVVGLWQGRDAEGGMEIGVGFLMGMEIGIER